LKNWEEDPRIVELDAIRNKFLGSSPVELSGEQGKLTRAIVVGRLSFLFKDHCDREILVQEFRKIDFDPVGDWAEDEDGKPVPIFYSSDYLDHIYGGNEKMVQDELARRYKRALSKFLLQCITAVSSETNNLPAFITPSVDLSFLSKSDAGMLTERWEEAYKARLSGLVLSSTVLLVSFIEGVLGLSFERALNPDEVKKYGKTKSKKGDEIYLPIEEWTLEMIIFVGKKELQLSKTRWEMISLAQQTRNLIHPLKAKSKKQSATLEDLDSIWVAVQALIPEVRKFVQVRLP